MLKRIFDVTASAIGLLLLSPVFLLIAVVLKRESPGPVFYRGPRAGRGGRDFGILKFRTMHERPESYDGPKVTAQGDSRITPVGQWLRDTKLNELPQLWNVFVGEMSLVGPRPEDPSLARTWPEDVRQEILSVRPGITSPASVIFRDEEKMLNSGNLMDMYLGEIMPSKMRLDQLYVRHHTFLLDLDVLFWTFLVVMVPKLRNHQPPEDTLFWGPIARIGSRYVNWFLIDALTTFLAFATVGLIQRIAVSPLDIGILPAILISFCYSMLFSSLAAMLGVQKIDWSSAGATEALDLVPPVTLSFLAAWAVNAWLKFSMPFSVIVDVTILSFIGYIFTRYRTRIITGIYSRWINLRRDRLIVRERVLIVGAGETGQFAAWRLSQNFRNSNYQIVGFVDDDMQRQGVRFNRLSVLGKREDLARLVEQHDVGLIIFAIHNISAEARRAFLEDCRSTKARVVIWPDMVKLLRMRPNKHVYAASGTIQAPPVQESDGERQAILKQLDLLEAHLNEGDFEMVMEQIYEIRTALQTLPQAGRDES